MPIIDTCVDMYDASVLDTTIPNASAAALNTANIVSKKDTFGAATATLTMAKTSVAATKALATPELLENVLIHLDMRTLLLAQRVNHFWKDSITGSSKLQKKLFFLPVKDMDEVIRLHMLDEFEDQELQRSGATDRIMSTGDFSFLVKPEHRDWEQAALLNPLLNYAPRKDVAMFRPLRLEIDELVPRSSWCRMFLTQPSSGCDLG